MVLYVVEWWTLHCTLIPELWLFMKIHVVIKSKDLLFEIFMCFVFSFYDPASIDWGHVIFVPSVCLSAKAFTLIGNSKGLHIWHEYTLWQDLSVCNKFKVIYQGQAQISRSVFKKMVVAGAFVFHKHILLSCDHLHDNWNLNLLQMSDNRPKL